MKTTDNISWKLRQRVSDTIKSNHLVGHGDGVVVGVSGGPDSVCLLHVLHSLSPRFGIKLHAVHINHLLRAGEAQADEDYTAELCRKLDIPLSIARVNVAELADRLGMSLEEAGREARYSEFDAIARKAGASRIAVAHNRNDQAETVMMHIIRGSGTAGLAGMEYRRGSVIRPLLNISRLEIEQYCKAEGLSPRTDSTNLESDFTRNRVRLELFPYINEQFDGDIVDSLNRLSSLASADNSYLDACADAAYTECLSESESDRKIRNFCRPCRDNGGPIPETKLHPGNLAAPACTDPKKPIRLNVDRLRKLHPAILGRVFRRAVCDLLGNRTGLGNIHYDALKELAMDGKTGARTELPRDLRAVVSYGVIEIYKSDAPGEEAEKTAVIDIRPAVPGVTDIPEWDARIVLSLETPENIDNYGKIRYNSLVQFFDYDSLRMGINIRNRRDGDIFKPFRSNGSKKLKEYFIDCKIPREVRDTIPLVCSGKEIVWVIGHKISDKFKVTENTKSVLKMEYNRRASL